MKKGVLLYLLLLSGLLVFNCRQNTEPPELAPEWADVTLTATGMGAPPNDAENEAQSRLMACNAAKMDAYRQLEEQIFGIRIDSKTFVKNYITQNDEMKAETEGFIKNAEIVRTKENDDGSCEVTVQLYLGKAFADIIQKK